jgi:hypothetical protein
MAPAARHEQIRLQNVRIAASARRHHFDGTTGVPFLCECDDELCHEFVVVTLRAMEHALRNRYVVVAEAHSVEGGQPAGGAEGYALVRVAA